MTAPSELVSALQLPEKNQPEQAAALCEGVLAQDANAFDAPGLLARAPQDARAPYNLAASPIAVGELEEAESVRYLQLAARRRTSRVSYRVDEDAHQIDAGACSRARRGEILSSAHSNWTRES